MVITALYAVSCDTAEPVPCAATGPQARTARDAWMEAWELGWQRDWEGRHHCPLCTQVRAERRAGR